MFKWIFRLFLLIAACIAFSLVAYMTSWSQPDMTNRYPSDPPFARCEGDCPTSHPNPEVYQP